MAQYDLGPNGGALSFCLSVSVFQLENANPNPLNSDKKKEVSHVLALRVQTELRPLAISGSGVLYGLFRKKQKTLTLIP